MSACCLGGFEACWLCLIDRRPSLTIKLLCFVPSRRRTRVEYVVRRVDADPTFSPGPTEFRGALHPEAGDCVSRGVQLREFPVRPDGWPHRRNRRAAAVDGDRNGSHATPAQGLYTSIVGGFVVSLLSGSRFQIGGPAGAFVVLVAATVQQHGMDGLILATILSGIMLMGIGYLRLGTYISSSRTR
jgi:hypothetical protein